MKFYPVIMCGGSGTRLWPLSRPARPKQFIPMVGPQSTFQATLIRLSSLKDAAPPLVVAGVAHAGAIAREIAEAGVGGEALFEPMARDSAPAVAAAAAWIARHDPEGIAVIVASDHHIPDDEAFLEAVTTAGVAAAQGWVVTLGVDPTGPATAYGYIHAGELLDGAAPVRRNQAFVEKPNAATAAGYVEAGYLWNSGNFIARADVLLAELDRYAPAVSAAAREAVSSVTAHGRGWRLGPGFVEAPKISLDYAIMEPTERSAVLPVSFPWSDLGAWDAVWAASAKDEAGNAAGPDAILIDAKDCFVSITPGLQVALVGTRRLAVVSDEAALLICDLDSSQGVKAAAEAAGRAAASAPAPADSLKAWAGRYDLWLRASALPAWWTLGGDHVDGGFHELVGLDGRPVAAAKRARVQPRQVIVYAGAAKLGLPGPWAEAAEHGWRFFDRHYRRPDGLYRTLVSATGEPLDETPYLYDHAFALLALATRHGIAADPAEVERQGEALVRAVRDHFRCAGGYKEAGDHPFQANALMHLLESALAWMEVDGGEVWRELAAELIDLALARFIDPKGQFLREFYEADWSPAKGEAGRLVEPGHQFEWAWLLDRWARIAGSAPAAEAARALFAAGLAGWDPGRGVAIDALDDELGVASAKARLWPQTEMLKAALQLAPGATNPADRAAYEAHAVQAAAGLWRYLETSVVGLWRDKLGVDGQFVAEPAPASSFYHIVGAIYALARYAGPEFA